MMLDASDVKPTIHRMEYTDNHSLCDLVTPKMMPPFMPSPPGFTITVALVAASASSYSILTVDG